MSEQKPHSHNTDETLDAVIKETLDMEERLLSFWQKYQKFIIVGLAAIVAIPLFRLGIESFSEWQTRNLQENYRQAVLDKKLDDFAMNNVKEPLAGTYFLQQGDEQYEAKNYPAAREKYQLAAKSYNYTEMSFRPQLGIAMCDLMEHKIAEAKPIFEKLMKDSKGYATVRAQAAYQLGLIALQEKDKAKAEKYFNFILDQKTPTIWTQKVQYIKNTILDII